MTWAKDYFLVLVELKRFTESEAVVDQLNSLCANVEGGQAGVICQNVPIFYVHLYTNWNEHEPGSGYDERAAHWQAIVDAPRPTF